MKIIFVIFKFSLKSLSTKRMCYLSHKGAVTIDVLYTLHRSRLCLPKGLDCIQFIFSDVNILLYYISEIVRALRLVNLAGRILQYGTLNLKICCCALYFKIKRYYKYLTNLVFSVRTVNYGPLFFPFDLWPARFALGP